VLCLIVPLPPGKIPFAIQLIIIIIIIIIIIVIIIIIINKAAGMLPGLSHDPGGAEPSGAQTQLQCPQLHDRRIWALSENVACSR
jgi:hypothetical protein